jgi:hypothetical protein
MLPLDSIVGELHIVNGRRQSTTTLSGAFTAPRRGARGRQNDTLFILADPGGSSALVPDLIQRIQEAYWHTPGSVTAGLRTAIEAGNEWLLGRNQSAPAATRAGVTCAVLRESEVFIAQVGSSCAYVAHQGRLERFPRGDAPGTLPPLGVARAVEVRFSRADLHPGDVLLLTDPAFAMRTPEAAIASAIVYVGVETAIGGLERLAGSDNLTALVVEVTANPEAASAPAPQPASSSAPGAQPPAAPSRVGTAQPARKVGEWAGALGQGLSRGAGSLGAATRAMLQRALPDRPAAPRHTRRRGPSALEQHSRLMMAIAIGIPLLVAVVVSAVYVERSTAAQIDTLLTDAHTLMLDADAAPSIESKRERWLAALQRAETVIDLAPQSQEALTLRAQAQSQLDRLDNTQRVTPALLHDFGRSGSHRLATQGVSLFVMDQRDGRIDRLVLNSGGDGIEGGGPQTAVIAKGVAVGERVVGDLIDMVWVGAGGARQKSTLVVLERGGLVEYDLAFGPAALRFADTGVSAGARRIDTFDGNLYMLDVTARQVWRYLPAADGYPALPETYFETPPAGIENTIDMAIDGNVYLLYSDGTIHKYLAGTPTPGFEMRGLPSPISGPVALAVDPETPTDSGIYVADADGARILHFTGDGRFVRQIRSPGDEFDALEDLLVDERANRLIVLSAGRVYAAALPPATAAP